MNADVFNKLVFEMENLLRRFPDDGKYPIQERKGNEYTVKKSHLVEWLKNAKSQYAGCIWHEIMHICNELDKVLPND